MKSIRQQILNALVSQGEATADAMLDQCDGITRRQIVDNVSQMVKEGLATRRLDDVLRVPAYKITELGKSRIGNQGGKTAAKTQTVAEIETVAQVPEKIEENNNSVIKQSLTTESVSPDYEVLKSKMLMLETELAHANKLAYQNASEVVKAGNLLQVAHDNELLMESMLGDERAKAQELRLQLDDKDAELSSIKAAFDEVHEMRAEVVRVRAENEQLKDSIFMSLKNTRYLVRSKNHYAQYCSKHESAQKTALRLASTEGHAEVFSLVKIGKAVKGANWVAV